MAGARGAWFVAAMSTARPIYKVQRGEPIVVGWEVFEGNPAAFTVSALLKPCLGQVVPPAETPAAAEFDVTFEPAAGSQKPRWIFTVPGEITAGFAPGQFCFDLRFELAGETVLITDPAFVTLVQSVSG